ncbi:MAG: metal-dependent hydrolase [Dehalobacter sp. 4CP]|uniref:metal-dependent hydrolase n=1 Tax=Dehalobacter sp. CP TaxID=2594474 RepID=UPI0013C7047F|nr:metal-dependent hydrolase [Dehalobacter sp.]NBJ15885.1 metal-dependent hydrolase [Dehalobacter sp. 4CP]
MIFFGHLGLTGLAAKAAEKSLGNIQIDYRIVFVGSILPDLIDKPIGRFLFAETFHTGRVFAHTVLFLFLLLGIGYYRWQRYRKNGWLVLAGSCLCHDIFDAMWVIPQTFYWPLYGPKFYASTEASWLQADWIKLMTDPASYVPEIAGLLIILYFLRNLIVHHQVKDFLKNGGL